MIMGERYYCNLQKICFIIMKSPRLFTVLYFSVRSSRSSALCYGLPSCMSVKTTKGEGAVWVEATLPPPPPEL